MRQRFTNHFLFWALYLAFEIYTEFEWIQVQHRFGAADALYAASIAETLLVVAVKIPMVYALFWLFERFAMHRQRLRFFVWSAVVFLACSLLSRTITAEYLMPEVYKMEVSPFFMEFQGVINSFMDAVFIAGIAMALKQHNWNLRLAARQKAVLQEKLETELALLKAQVNPHFLFNTLNSIYALALRKSDHTAQTVLRLSKLLRFMLYEAQARHIPLDIELRFLQDYIALEQIRYDQRLRVVLDASVENEQLPVPPLLLIILLENAFKHGASESTQEAFIEVLLSESQGRLQFAVRNSFEPGLEPATREGIGLKNLKRRLELLQPQAVLTLSKQNHIFSAQLELNLKQL